MGEAPRVPGPEQGLCHWHALLWAMAQGASLGVAQSEWPARVDRGQTGRSARPSLKARIGHCTSRDNPVSSQRQLRRARGPEARASLERFGSFSLFRKQRLVVSKQFCFVFPGLTALPSVSGFSREFGEFRMCALTRSRGAWTLRVKRGEITQQRPQ